LSIGLVKGILSFNVSTNSGVFVVFVVASQGKHSSHIRSAGQINSPSYKLTKTTTPEDIHSSIYNPNNA